MDAVSQGSIACSTYTSMTNHFFSDSVLHTGIRVRTLIFPRKPKRITVFASKEEEPPPKLNQWEQMDLKFGRLLGEDPKLALSKIKVRRSNPHLSYLEIEESLGEKKGKVLMNDIKEVPFDVPTKRNSLNSKNELMLVRPEPRKGVKFEIDDKESIETKETKPGKQVSTPVENSKKSVPNVVLRKPTVYFKEDTASLRASRLRTPNLALNMPKEPEKTRFSDMTLLKKPEPIRTSSSENEKKPEPKDLNQENDQEQETVYSLDGLEQSSGQVFALNNLSETRSVQPLDAALLAYLERLPQNEAIPANNETNDHEDGEWTRAEDLFRTGKRGEVALISSSSKGFVVSFGSLIGFLPYRNIATSWRFLAFESWLRMKGLEPSKYKQNLGVTRNYGDSIVDSSQNDEKLENLLSIYDKEKLTFLTSFVGQMVKVSVVLADRKYRRLTVSMKTMENKEMIKKKRSLMSKLRIGDVLKCRITKIAYFGILVEVEGEGVPALVHQTQVSWDATLDPMSYFKIGQIVDAKVHHLYFSLDRIYLSLKDITPDPLKERLVGDHDHLDGNLQAAQPDAKVDGSNIEQRRDEICNS